MKKEIIVIIIHSFGGSFSFNGDSCLTISIMEDGASKTES